MAEETVRLWPTAIIWDAVGIGHEKADHFGLGIGGYVDVPKGPHALALIKKGGYVEMPDIVAPSFAGGASVLMRPKDPRNGAGGSCIKNDDGTWIVPVTLAGSLVNHGFEYVTDSVGLPVAAAAPGSAMDRLQEIEPALRAAIARIAELLKGVEKRDIDITDLHVKLSEMDAALSDAVEQLHMKDARIAELEKDIEALSQPTEAAPADKAKVSAK